MVAVLAARGGSRPPSPHHRGNDPRERSSRRVELRNRTWRRRRQLLGSVTTGRLSVHFGFLYLYPATPRRVSGLSPHPEGRPSQGSNIWAIAQFSTNEVRVTLQTPLGVICSWNTAPASLAWLPWPEICPCLPPRCPLGVNALQTGSGAARCASEPIWCPASHRGRLWLIIRKQLWICAASREPWAASCMCVRCPCKSVPGRELVVRPSEPRG